MFIHLISALIKAVGRWSYVVQGDALHGLVLLQGVHLVQVAVSDEDSPVLCLVEVVDLENTKLLISHTRQNTVGGKKKY